VPQSPLNHYPQVTLNLDPYLKIEEDAQVQSQFQVQDLDLDPDPKIRIEK